MKKHSNLYHELGQAHRRQRAWGWSIAIIILLIIALLFAYWHVTNAMMETNYKYNVHLCVSEVRVINQYNATSHLNVEDCLNDNKIQ
jgi:hypothetical protein